MKEAPESAGIVCEIGPLNWLAFQSWSSSNPFLCKENIPSSNIGRVRAFSMAAILGFYQFWTQEWANLCRYGHIGDGNSTPCWCKYNFSSSKTDKINCHLSTPHYPVWGGGGGVESFVIYLLSNYLWMNKRWGVMF